MNKHHYAGTGFLAGGNNLTKMTVINSGSSALQAYTEGQDPRYAAGASLVATVGGYTFGRGVQSTVHKVVAGNVTPNIKYYDKKYLDKNFLKQFNDEYTKIPRFFGAGSENIASEYIFDRTQTYLKNNTGRFSLGTGSNEK